MPEGTPETRTTKNHLKQQPLKLPSTTTEIESLRPQLPATPALALSLELACLTLCHDTQRALCQWDLSQGRNIGQSGVGEAPSTPHSKESDQHQADTRLRAGCGELKGPGSPTQDLHYLHSEDACISYRSGGQRPRELGRLSLTEVWLTHDATVVSAAPHTMWQVCM